MYRRAFFVVLVSMLHGLLLAGCSWAQPKTAPPVEPAQPTIEVTEPLGFARTHWPVSVGVPFPAGALKDASQLRITAANAPTALQSRVLSRWPDGSARWVLLDWQADMQPHQERRFRVAAGAPAGAAAQVQVTDHGDRIQVDTGPLQFTVPRNRFALLNEVRVDGKPVVGGPIVSFFTIDGKRVEAQAPRSVTVTERGPLRVRIELRGHYASAFDYVVRIDAFGNQPFVRVLHTFEQHAPEAYILVRQIGIDVPLSLHGKPAYRVGREKDPPLAGALPATGFTVFQADNEAWQAGGVRQPGHAAGWADVSDATHGLAVAARFFWQEYPQSFQLRATGLTYNLWAPEAPPAKVGMGAAKTHELVLFFHGATPPTPALLAALTQPLLGHVDPQWVVSTGALRNSVAPSAASTPFLRELGAAYQRTQTRAAQERWDDSGQVRCPDPAQAHPRTGFFGMFNWGDWNFPGYHDTTKGCDAWGNLEYDLTQVLALAYAATGEPAYHEGMTAAARHFMDVDRIYYQRKYPSWVGMNHPKNPLHFSFELGGVDLGHTWTEGLLSYYSLTGDARALDAARGIADYLVQRARTAGLRGNPRQWGWPQIALVATYEATGNDTYKQAAREYARQGMAGHPPDRISGWKLGILAEGLAYTHSVTHDPAIQDWLARYATALGTHGAAADVRFFPAVAYVGRLLSADQHTRAAVANAARLSFGNWAKPFTIAGRLGFSILSMTADRPVGERPH